MRIRRLILIVILALAGIAAYADEPSALKRAVRGYTLAVVNGDTVPMVVLNEVVCYPDIKFKNKKEEEYYWKTVRDVKKALPYAKLICETLTETYEYIETFPTQKEREDHIKKMENAVFEQYKPALKQFTKGQATMLIKLIKRETNQSGYGILKAFLGSARATFWQCFGRLFGVNLKTDFRPGSNRDDMIIENIAVKVEQGVL